MKQGLRYLLVVTALALCTAGTASANFLYDLHVTAVANIVELFQVRFVVPAIFTSPATVTDFVVVTNFYHVPMVAVELDPMGITGDCGGPCFIFDFSDGGVSGFSGLPVFTSVGFFSHLYPGVPAVTATVTISQAPEPATFALLGLGLAGLGFSRHKQ